jgi:hypothetical protein
MYKEHWAFSWSCQIMRARASIVCMSCRPSWVLSPRYQNISLCGTRIGSQVNICG